MSTPTKAAEIREALEELREDDWTKEYKDQIIDRALALLADMEREGEPVKQAMTPDTTIEQQARREAEEPTLTVADALRAITPFTSKDIEEHYRARLTEAAKARSKPRPSVDEVMEVAKQWNRDMHMNTPAHEPYSWQQLRDRLTKLFNP